MYLFFAMHINKRITADDHKRFTRHIFIDDLHIEILLYSQIMIFLLKVWLEDHCRAQYTGVWAIVDITEDTVDLNTRAGETS